MKAITKNPNCPSQLQSHIAVAPDDTWESFKLNTAAYNEVKESIKKDQRGICCYCEIDFMSESVVPDFRVEHFYPKSLTPCPDGSNAHLSWENLLGCCFGGSERHKPALNTPRFTSPDLHCDAIKGDKDLTNVILNPLHLNSTDKIFKYNSEGEMLVDLEYCPEDLIEKANNTINDLNLNQMFLLESRKEVRFAVLNTLHDLVIVEKMTLSQAQSLLHNELIISEAIPKFYSCKWDAIYY